MKISISEIPVTMSAFSIGILRMLSITVRFRLFILFRDREAIRPRSVAMVAESSARISVLRRAPMISASWNI